MQTTDVATSEQLRGKGSSNSFKRSCAAGFTKDVTLFWRVAGHPNPWRDPNLLASGLQLVLQNYLLTEQE